MPPVAKPVQLTSLPLTLFYVLIHVLIFVVLAAHAFIFLYLHLLLIHGRSPFSFLSQSTPHPLVEEDCADLYF